MTSFLVVYETNEGQTAKVANTIEEVPSEEGHTGLLFKLIAAVTTGDTNTSKD
jgi:flavodoxin